MRQAAWLLAASVLYGTCGGWLGDPTHGPAAVCRGATSSLATASSSDDTPRAAIAQLVVRWPTLRLLLLPRPD